MILHLDFSTGASGDKILGALLDACEKLGCASAQELQELFAAILPNVIIEISRNKQNGEVMAVHINVAEPSAPHRHFSDIRTLIKNAGESGLLTKTVVDMALKTFTTIADAEARVHGINVEKIHFHEIGASDSIVDIVGVSFLLEQLATFNNHRSLKVYASPLALGTGTVTFSHGTLPVPAPATALLVQGLPVYAGIYESELTTPTGAALARAIVNYFQPFPTMCVSAIGFGAGSRQLDGTANVVRALVGNTKCDMINFKVAKCDSAKHDETNFDTAKQDETKHDTTNDDTTNDDTAKQDETKPLEAATNQLAIEQCLLLETNIDHLSSEALAFACEELMSTDEVASAKDFSTKKSDDSSDTQLGQCFTTDSLDKKPSQCRSTGILDVWQEPIVMKKGRAAWKLCVLTSPSYAHIAAERIIRLTGTLGVRKSLIERVVAPRQVVTLKTRFGQVPFKVCLLRNVSNLQNVSNLRSDSNLRNDSNAQTNSWLRPEHEAVAKIAREQNIDYNDVLSHLQQDALSAIFCLPQQNKPSI
ncbi:MAG: LarC family nickel insertion protein [Coriobacteriales bacterium]|jgi:uncharacterized protein (TIGR00299 family) protein|nr:LarC family nickel insertion protein [Coriobacteriales bacterium]